jgi:cysteine synthase
LRTNPNHWSAERTLARLEYLNLGPRKEDRAAIAIVGFSQADDWLALRQPVLKMTRGNTGTTLAIVRSAYGHSFVAVMSRSNTISPSRWTPYMVKVSWSPLTMEQSKARSLRPT